MDAPQWEGLHEAEVPDNLPEAHAEIRRLRSALIRIDTELGGARSWQELLAVVRRAREHVAQALPSRRAGTAAPQRQT